MRTLSIAVIALLQATYAFKLQACPPEPECFSAPLPPCAGPVQGESCSLSGGSLQNVDTSTLGYGKIQSVSKAQSQNAAKADNQYDSVEEQLKYCGANSEEEQGSTEGEGVLIQKEIIKIDGKFEAEELINQAEAAKVAESAKSATCFRRESKQSLNELCGQNLPAPLAGPQSNLGGALLNIPGQTCCPRTNCGC